MPVVKAQDQVNVLPNCVYVIPPNRDMAIFHGMLQLSVPDQPHGQRMPIDAFLRSLAENRGEQAIGIGISGTGTDGTLGLARDTQRGWRVSLVQDPETAKYDGMHKSAIQTCYATHVLAVEKMQELLGGIRTLNLPPEAPATVTRGLNRILMHLRSATGHDFTQYKKNTIGRRFERRGAAMRKLVHLCFGVIKTQKPYQHDYPKMLDREGGIYEVGSEIGICIAVGWPKRTVPNKLTKHAHACRLAVKYAACNNPCVRKP